MKAKPTMSEDKGREIKFRVWDKEADEPFMSPVRLDGYQLYNYITDDRYEVMQFTGLRDRHSKTIYEGDLCLYDGLPGVKNGLPIIWYRGSFFLQGRMGSDTKLLSQIATSREMEVIGNIYQNKDLL